MGERDEYKRLLKKAEQDRAFDPHNVDQLKRAEERRLRAERSKLRREVALKKLQEERKALDQEMRKRGIATINERKDAQQLIVDAKRQAEADRQQGTTEKPTQTI